MAYSRLNLSNGTKLTEEHFKHIEDAIYDLSVGGDGSKSFKSVKLCLPKLIRWETNKPLYIYKHTITNAFNYKDYNIQVTSMSANEKDGKDYPRYFIYTPKAEGTTTITFTMFDNAGNVLDTKNVVVEAVGQKTPDTSINVLFIGDSLTYYNRISDEFYRIMTSSEAATTVKDTISIYNVSKPKGRGIKNINLIGTQKINYKGWVGATPHEGRSGWQWSNFNTSSSPFYNSSTKKLDFDNYCSKNGFAKPDVIYIGLGWNDTKNIPINDTDIEVNVDVIYNNAKTFLNALTAQWPDVKVRLWGQNVPGTRGGIGNHVWGAIPWTDEHRLKVFMQAIAAMNERLADEYPSVEAVWTTCMIDSEYSLQEAEANINSRITDKEVLGTDYVHPADSGFFQIVDGIVSDFMHCLSGTEIDYTQVPSTPLTFTASPVGNAVMYYNNEFKYFYNSTTLVNYGSKILMVDVSDYIGKQLKLTVAQAVIENAYYTILTSKLPTGLDSLENLTSFNGSGYIEDNTDMLDYSNTSTTDKTTRTTVITVPAGAKYLAITNLYTYCAEPYIGLVTES